MVKHEEDKILFLRCIPSRGKESVIQQDNGGFVSVARENNQGDRWGVTE